MSSIILLFVLGLILLGLEVFVPGAILGIFGGLALLGGTVVAFIDHGPGGGLAALLVAVVLVGLLLYLEFRVLPRTAVGRRLFLQSAINGRSGAAPGTAGIIGRSGAALTTLAPSGYVLVDGRRYEAYSESGYIPAGAALRVVGRDNFRIIVTKV